MSEWKKLKLGDICIIGDGAHASLKRQKEGILYITAKNLSENGLVLSNADYISHETYNQYFKDNSKALTKPRKNDILYSIIGSIGGCYLIKDEVLGVSSSVAIFRCKDAINPMYLFYYLKSDEFKNEIDAIKGGVAQGFMSLSKIGSVAVTLPPLSTQHRIATFLSRYDSLIENYQKQIKLLEEAAQRLYKEWFVDLRFPGHETTKIVDGVPEGWEKKTIADVCTNIYSGSTPSRSNKAYWDNGTIKWVKTKELQDGWILDTEEYISQEGYNSSSTKMFPANTILMAIYASPTLGRLGILSTDCCCNQAALGLIADENIISWQWLFWKLYELRDEFNAIARGAGQQNISGIVVKNKEIIIPNKGVIDGFTSVVSKMFEQQKSLSSQLRLLTEARDRLLPKLMSGEITV